MSIKGLGRFMGALKFTIGRQNKGLLVEVSTSELGTENIEVIALIVTLGSYYSMKRLNFRLSFADVYKMSLHNLSQLSEKDVGEYTKCLGARLSTFLSRDLTTMVDEAFAWLKGSESEAKLLSLK